MVSHPVNVQQIFEKIRALPSDELFELDNFIEFLRFKTQNPTEAATHREQRRVHLRGILTGYEIAPEMLADMRRELWLRTIGPAAIPELSDRIIAATALALDLPLLTTDSAIIDSGLAETLD